MCTDSHACPAFHLSVLTSPSFWKEATRSPCRAALWSQTGPCLQSCLHSWEGSVAAFGNNCPHVAKMDISMCVAGVGILSHYREFSSLGWVIFCLPARPQLQFLPQQNDQNYMWHMKSRLVVAHALQSKAAVAHIQIRVQAAFLGCPTSMFMSNCSKGSAFLYACRKGRLAGAELLDMAHRLASVWLLPASPAGQGALL